MQVVIIKNKVPELVANAKFFKSDIWKNTRWITNSFSQHIQFSKG